MVTPKTVRDIEFKIARLSAGYSSSEVDAFLDRCATALEAKENELGLARAKVAELQRSMAELTAKLSEYSDRPTVAIPVNATLILESAQRAADEAIEEAEKQAKRIIEEAQGQADLVLRGARTKGDKLVDDAQSKADALLWKAKEEANRVTNEATVKVRQLEAQFEDLRLREDQLRKHLTTQLTAITRNLEQKEE